VATVKPYFERFLKALPTIAALARADEEHVLRLWEGLGYYRRARQLHRAARKIVAEHGGVFPRDAEAVRQLPGIGRYTAGAILSIAFDARRPILEANTARLLSRLLAYRGDPASAPGQKLLWAVAEAVLPRRGTGLFNQALMELGSTVCVPREPRCGVCPAASLCRAHALGIEAQIPSSKAKPAIEARHEAAVVVCRAGRVLLVRGPEGGRWAGLWDFPRSPVRSQAGQASCLSPDCLSPNSEDLRRELVEAVRRQTGVTIRPPKHHTTLKHGVTRFRITLECYLAEFASGAPSAHHAARDASAIRWVSLADLDRYPLHSTARKLARMVAGDAAWVTGGG
jgi:A/G-specific adenine glycosylase